MDLIWILKEEKAPSSFNVFESENVELGARRQPWSTSNDEGPNLAWLWKYDFKPELLYAEDRVSDLRQWVYIIWGH